MPRSSRFTDAWDEIIEREEALSPPDDGDRLLAKIVNYVRGTNITVSPPAHQKPIVWSEALDLTTRVSVPAAMNSYVTAIQWTSPPGRWTRIETFGVTVQDAAYTYNGSILWRFRKNGQQLSDGLSDWGIQKGSVVLPRSTFIILEEGDTLEFQVRRAVAAAGAQDVDMSLTGYTWLLRNNYEGTQGSVTSW